MTSHPIVVGIIGGVASGKSEVANQLVKGGAVRINADEIGHGLLQQDPRVRSAVLELLGQSVLDHSNQIDRKKIAALVFGGDKLSRSRRVALEAILHPAIRRSAEARLGSLRHDSNVSIIVLDAPLLVEAGWASLCDEIIFVDTPLVLRQQMAARRGWSTDELERREAAQLSLAEKRFLATKVIVNDSDLGQLRKNVDEIYAQLKIKC